MREMSDAKQHATVLMEHATAVLCSAAITDGAGEALAPRPGFPGFPGSDDGDAWRQKSCGDNN